MIVTLAALRAVTTIRINERDSSFSDTLFIHWVYILKKYFFMLFNKLLIARDFLGKLVLLSADLRNLIAPLNKFDCVMVDSVLLESMQKLVSDRIG